MWGPSNTTQSPFPGIPYAPFSKGDKLGKVADWASDPSKDSKEHKRAQGRGFRDPYHAYGASASSFFTSDENDHQIFNVVNTIQTPAFNTKISSKPTVLRARKSTPQQSQVRQNRGPRTMTIGSATLHNRRGAQNRQNWNQNDKRVRKPSIQITPNFRHIQTNNMTELLKLSFEVPEFEVLGEFGYVNMFNKQMDKLQTSLKLKPVDVTEYNVGALEDPIMKSFDFDGVFATDAVIAQLMCAPKSNNPWDILVVKKNGKIFFDKRESVYDLPSVDENSLNPPMEVSDQKIDSSSALGLEASYVNLNFEANVVDKNTKLEFAKPNPFSSGDEPANQPLLPKAYIYKQFSFGEGEKPLVVRMEVDCAVEVQGKKKLATVFALNEYGGVSKQLEWKERFQSHRGAIVAAEMKNNLNKLSQWTARSLLAGVDTMKIGFVSRINPKDNQSHEIVSVLSPKPEVFASQLNFNLKNGWGIIKSLVDVFEGLEDGKYVLMRDPVMPSVSIYEVPEGEVLEDA